MSGSADDWIMELRKFSIIDVVSPNFESVNLEKLTTLQTDKPVKLQKIIYEEGGPMTKLELFFTNGLESAALQIHSSRYTAHEQTWDSSKQIKKISIKLQSGGRMCGMKFLDEKDNEIVKWDHDSNTTWTPAKEIPDGFEIIGLYADTRKDYDAPQFGFLIWNPKPI